MSTLELQFGGFGGQGVILAGMTVGRGLVIYDGLHVSLTQSFGPEARGSACSCQLIVSDEAVLYPYMTKPHVLVALSQEAYRKFAPNIRPDGILVLEEHLVKTDGTAPCAQVFRVPAMKLAEELGRKMVLNMVLVGFFAAVTQELPKEWGFPKGLIRPESARKAVSDSVPAGTEALNLAAFDKGFQHGMALLAASVR
jgi:2-oxoglutarate ferredoxin oxidoreductase subunit gamma